MNVFKLRTTLGFTVAAALSVFASAASAESLVAINSNNQVSVFDSSNAVGAVFNTIFGAAAGKTFVGIDLRPSNNTVYGVTTSNEIYTLNAYTGNSSFVAALSNNIITSANGYDLDFNPVNEALGTTSFRIVGSNGQNFAVNANTGAVTNFANNQPSATTPHTIGTGYTGVSYTNSNPSVPASSTSLYYINSSTDELFVATSAFNTPTITKVGALGHEILRANGLDISASGIAYSSFLMDDGTGKSALTTINLATGAATKTGDFLGTINGLTIAPVPEPETYAMLLAGLGLIGVASRRKSKKT